MTRHPSTARRAHLRKAACFFAMMAITMGTATAAAPALDESELLKAGFKVLVATNDVQHNWVVGLPPGKIRPMQRTGKKYFIYPDAAKNQIYVGGPAEYERYTRAHPEELQAAQHAKDAAVKESARRGKEAAAMQAATGRDLSDPFLGVSWADLGW